MIGFFANSPIIEYDGVSMRNLVKRAGIVRSALAKYDVYYPYRIRDWERADTIAFDYYGDSVTVSEWDGQASADAHAAIVRENPGDEWGRYLSPFRG